MPTSNDVKEMR